MGIYSMISIVVVTVNVTVNVNVTVTMRGSVGSLLYPGRRVKFQLCRCTKHIRGTWKIGRWLEILANGMG